MHELSVVKALIDTVNDYKCQHQANAVKAVRVAVGTLTCVDQERLVFCFDMVKQEANLANAELHVDAVQAIAECKLCNEQYQIQQVAEPCKCGCFQHQVLCGNELNLTEIEFI